MRARARLACVAVIASLSTGGCADAGSAWVRGALWLPGCSEPEDASCRAAPTLDCAPFARDFDYVAVDALGGALTARMQTDGLGASQVDGLVMTVRDVEAAQATLGTPVSIAPGRDVEVALALFATCEESAPALRVEGTVIFSGLGVGEGDRVSGRFDLLRVSDARTGEALGALEGAFSFTVHAGSDSQRFVR